jgi:hypothetical protein
MIRNHTASTYNQQSQQSWHTARAAVDGRFETWVNDLKAQYRAAVLASEGGLGAPAVPPESFDEEQDLLEQIDRVKLELRECALEQAREEDLIERCRATFFYILTDPPPPPAPSRKEKNYHHRS